MSAAPLLLALACAASAADPQLRGIVAFEGKNLALLEIAVSPQRQQLHPVVLQAGERLGEVEVQNIDERSGAVGLRVGGAAVTLSLKQDQPVPGRTLHLESAPLPQVLDVYELISGRTLLRPQSLPAARIDLSSGPALAAGEALPLLANALRDVGVVLTNRGTKFVFATPTDRTPVVAKIPDPPAESPGKDNQAFPAGIIRFSSAEKNPVLDLYAESTGRTVLWADRPPYCRITVATRNAVTRHEVEWMLQALFRLEGFVLRHEGAKFAILVAADGVLIQHLPRFDEVTAAAKTRQPAAPATVKLVEASPAQLLTMYAALVGRNPVPPSWPVPAVKVSLRSQQPLTPGEAIYALETVALLHNLRLEFVGGDGVTLAPGPALKPNPPGGPRLLPP